MQNNKDWLFEELQRRVAEIDDAVCAASDHRHDYEQFMEGVRRCIVGLEAARFAANKLHYEATSDET